MHRGKRQPIVEILERRFLMSATYNRTAAVAYANQYAYEVVGDGYFWINSGTATYYGAGAPVPVNVSGEASGIGDDCAHFVSSCIGAPPGGGGGGLNIPSRAGTYGEPGAAALDELLLSKGFAQQVTSVSQLQPGDVIGYDWDGSGGGNMSGIDHTVVYLGNGEIAAHATSHDGVAWNWGNSSSTITFFVHITVPSIAFPNTPTNTLPANNAVVSTATPTLTASAFSETGATQAAADWQIFNGSTLVYDTGTTTSAKTSLTVPSSKLSSGNTYTWDVRYEDNSGNWSSYSTATSFTVTIGPNTPVNSSPANNASQFNPVALSAGAFSDTVAGATQSASEWVVRNSSNAIIYDSGIDTSDLSSITVPNGDLSVGQTYTWQVRYEDNSNLWSAYSTATSFTILPPSLLTLSGSALYLRDTADGQSLNVWNNTSPTGAANETISLAEITKVVINGVAGGSNVTLDFSNGNLSPQYRLTITGAGSTTNNVLSVIGSAGNDAVDYQDGQLVLNGTLVAYNDIGAFLFTPGAGTDSLSVDAGTLNLGATASGAVQLSSLGVSSGATFNIGSNTVYLSYASGHDPESTIQSLVSSGYNNGSWTGPGITSSALTANLVASGIGYYDIDNQITLGATWKGDANMDGTINADDLSIIALGEAEHKTDWSAGNFNYDTQINADDWIIFNYAVVYANGRNYRNVFAPGAALGSSTQMSQLLSTSML